MVVKNKYINNLFGGCDNIKVYGVFIRLLMVVDKKMVVRGSPGVVSKLIDVSISNFNLAVRELKRRELVRKYSRWEYMINPGCVGVDDIRDEKQLMYMWEKDSISGLRRAEWL